MKLALTQAGMANVYKVMGDLSDISVDELGRGGFSTWTGLKSAKMLLECGPADTLLEGGVPIAVLGHFPHGEHVRVTWFLGAKRYFELGPRGVVYTRRYFQSLQRGYPGTWFHSYSGSRHPDAARWFTLLGFKLDKITDAYTLYTLAPIAVSEVQDTSRAP